ncbi:hypothetical protein A2U01_0054657, partial [Trifolium medium]|nr:hypothetical protein [Trifolium medium]
VSYYLVDLYRVGVDCLEMVCELKRICLVDVLSGGLEVEECLSKNVISRPGVCFGIFIGIPLIYDAFVL